MKNDSKRYYSEISLNFKEVTFYETFYRIDVLPWDNGSTIQLEGNVEQTAVLSSSPFPAMN